MFIKNYGELYELNNAQNCRNLVNFLFGKFMKIFRIPKENLNSSGFGFIFSLANIREND